MLADPILNKRAARFIPVARPSVGWREALAVARVTLSGWISQGRKVAEFETMFAKSHGKECGSACNSGTTAIQLALAAAGIGEGDRVLCPAFTMVAVPNSILNVGAVPVFYDASQASLVGNSSIEEIRDAYLSACDGRLPQWAPRALIVAHCYGEVTAGMDKIRKWCDDKGIVLIEDCAEVHYARGAGSWGDMVCWSFYANKNITTGEGGMVTTDRAEFKAKMDRIRMHAFSPLRHFNHTEKAYGCRMTEMQAAMGIVQHKRSGNLMARRAVLRALYDHALACDVLEDPFWTPATTPESAWWVMPIICNTEAEREGLREWLAQDGIETRTYFVPMHQQDHLRVYAGPERFPRAEYLGRCGLYLPLYPAMSAAEVLYVARSVRAWADRI